MIYQAYKYALSFFTVILLYIDRREAYVSLKKKAMIRLKFLF